MAFEADADGYVYLSGTALPLYEPATMPTLPRLRRRNTAVTRWPSLTLGPEERDRILEADPVQECYDHDIPYREQADPTALILQTPLAVGKRDERPVQVWTARFQDSEELLVARLYDPLYFDAILWHDIFAHMERAVAIEGECYARLADFGGVLVPHYVGLFVAEVPGPRGPRHIYTILLRHIHGPDVRQLMDHGVAARTCAPHQAAIMDAAARILFQFFQRGIFPKDLKDSNTILQLPETPSTESFCPVSDCPFRNLIHVDFTFDPNSPGPVPHPYAPRVLLIDMEHLVFYPTTQDSYVRRLTIDHCRGMTLRQWEEQDHLGWVKGFEVSNVFLESSTGNNSETQE
ncbi:hypothetical protein C8R46DRAFT_1184526 [Mycena filopes]|nr:hypothetical protein C8R46DRAFT_1184526 [Mycena filopes]